MAVTLLWMAENLIHQPNSGMYLLVAREGHCSGGYEPVDGRWNLHQRNFNEQCFNCYLTILRQAQMNTTNVGGTLYV